MSGAVTLEFLAEQQARIIEELANIRADHAVLLAIVQRMDATLDSSHPDGAEQRLADYSERHGSGLLDEVRVPPAKGAP